MVQYLIIDTSHPDRLAAAVDPVDAEAIIRAAESEGAKITSILTTHNHWDHAGGNNKMVQLLGRQLDAVFGGRGDGAEGVTAEVDDASELRIGSLPVQVVFTVRLRASREPAGSDRRAPLSAAAMPHRRSRLLLCTAERRTSATIHWRHALRRWGGIGSRRTPLCFMRAGFMPQFMRSLITVPRRPLPG